MNITPEKLEKIKRILSEKHSNIRCNDCGSTKVTIADFEYYLMSPERNETRLNFSNIDFTPMVGTCCLNCGATKMYNMIVLLGEKEAIAQ